MKGYRRIFSRFEKLDAGFLAFAFIVEALKIVLTRPSCRRYICSFARVTVFDPTIPDSCLSAPNNVPLRLVQQSPVLRNDRALSGCPSNDGKICTRFLTGQF